MPTYNLQKLSMTLLTLWAILPIGCGELDEHLSPAAVYESTFGIKPSQQIRNLQGYGRAFRDSEDCYLKFQVAQSQLDAMLGDKFIPMTASEFEKATSGASIFGPAPAWWKPLVGSPTVFLRSGIFHPHYTQGRAFASYDADSQVAHLYWDGFD